MARTIDIAGQTLTVRPDQTYEDWVSPSALASDRWHFVYARLSDKDDPDADETSVEQQVRRIFEHLVSKEGATRVRFFVDHGFSASQLVVRPAFERMLAEAADPSCGTIWGWRVDRLARRQLDGERLIDMADPRRKRHVRVRSFDDGIDTDQPDGDERLRRRVDNAAYEAKAIRARTYTRRVELHDAGYWMSRDGYGHRFDRSGPPRRPKPLKAVPDEAEALREAARRIVEGTGTRTILRDWVTRGIRTRNGTEWQHVALHRILLSPRMTGRADLDQVLPMPECIEPILDDETADKLRAILTNPARRPSERHDGKVRHLLTNILRCGICHGPMAAKGGKGARNGTGYWVYACLRTYQHPAACGRNFIKGDDTDREVEAMTLDYWGLAPQGDPEPATNEAGTLREELATLSALITEREMAMLDGTLDVSLPTYRQWRQRALDQRDELEQRIRAAASVVPVPVTVTTVEETWEAMDIAGRRALVRYLWSDITVTAYPDKHPGRKRFIRERIRLTPAGDPG